MKLEVKKYKEFKALVHEGYPFTAQLWADDKHVADIEYDANGGPFNYYPVNAAAFTAVKTWVEAQPARPSKYGPLPPDLDLYVDEAITRFQTQKQVDKYRKKGRVCFVKAEDAERFSKEGRFLITEPGVPASAITAAFPGCTIL